MHLFQAEKGKIDKPLEEIEGCMVHRDIDIGHVFNTMEAGMN